MGAVYHQVGLLVGNSSTVHPMRRYLIKKDPQFGVDREPEETLVGPGVR
jgi:hypothetical protein